MGRNIPILNRDIEWCREWLEKNTSSPSIQKKLVLIVVSVALLLDNMLYMVIVPIIPRYLREIHAYEVEYVGYHNETTRLKNGSIVVKMIGGQIDYLDEEIELGWLFASKALLQIFVNPFSGFVIDRIGYELPMIIGLVVMFSSTAIFALGRSYGVLFFARSLQGFGSAFADTSGLAMIADRFTEENERSAALGIALAFISFGCLVAPPFGSVLYSIAGKSVPFLILSLICLVDAFMVFMVIQQKPNPVGRASSAADPSEKLHGTPMWKLFMDPFVAICSGALIMANVSLAFLEPTITTWMTIVMPDTPKWMIGMIWFPPFMPATMSFLHNWLGTQDEKQSIEWYMSALPKPPIPSLEHTLERYLQYASVVRHWDQVPAEDVERAVGCFFPVAEKLQEELKEIAETEPNWINHFWLETMYLKPRYPLPINSNPAYIFPRQVFYDEDDWLLYTASVAHGMLKFKDMIDRRELTPDNSGSVRGSTPYCMDQYDRLLSLYRQPGLGYDRQLTNRYRQPDTTITDQHLLIMCENQPFVLYVRKDGMSMEPAEIAVQLREIVQKARNRSRINSPQIGAATAGNREDCALFWMEMLGHEQNATSLNLIQSAVFAICLDGNVQQRFSNDNPLETAGGLILHGYGQNGQGLNRWYDCTLQLIVSLDGFSGLCIEHSVAEGIVIIRMMEHVLNKVRSERNSQSSLPTYTTNDHHYPLNFVLSDSNQKKLDKFANEFDNLALDLRLTLFNFTGFGKEFIKSNKISPDGFVQMALQLAHYRQHGYLVSSYESATMRRYAYGRVDNIRSATPETYSWVCGMFNRAVSMPQKRELFDLAAKKQALIISENVNGYGIDNHLCALENLAQEAVARGRLTGMPEMFRQKIYSELIRFPLSTSQVTPDPSFEDCYLCYGPVVKDGYGCAYSIQKDQLFFAISDMKSDSRTSGIGFEAALKEALAEMRYLLEATAT